MSLEAPLAVTAPYTVELTTPRPGGYYYYGPSRVDAERRVVCPGMGLVADVVVEDREAYRWVASGGARASCASHEIGAEFRTASVVSFVDFGVRTAATDDDTAVHPEFGGGLGVAANTITVTDMGAVTAFAPHFWTGMGVSFGRGAVRPRFEMRADAVARTDGWWGSTESPAGHLSWDVPAGSLGVRFLAGVAWGE